MIPSLSENYGVDHSDRSMRDSFRTSTPGGSITKPQPGADATQEQDPAEAPQGGIAGVDMLQIVREAETQASHWIDVTVRRAWERSYKAYRNEHFSDSKYNSEHFKTRSKIFRPKTRSAVRKSQASAVEALFSTADVVTVGPANEADKAQAASAVINQELLNYRLDRANGRNAVPWFLIATGARQDAMITGVCVSKQAWRFDERIDPRTGMPQRLIDRPDVTLYPPEDVLIDPAADWTNPAQGSAYLILRNPMQVDQIVNLMARNSSKAFPWRQIPKEELQVFTLQPSAAQATRRAREGGLDSKDRVSTGARFGIVWVYENFVRIDDEDYVFWSIGTQKMLSDPVPVRDAYPEQGGDRPVTFGYGSLDAHRVFPMAPVESWQQLQQESNDIANLRLDQMKQVVTPLTKVKRGQMVDVNAVMRRGSNTVVLVKDKDDIEFDRPPDVPASSYQEANYINADFDDLAATFNGSSVQTNRDLNETVGGMRLLAGASNQVGEFDLRVWVETWVEPTLKQIIKLEQHYEDDAKILAIAGERAQLYQKFNTDQITDQLLMTDVTLRVNVGTGAGSNDPLQKLSKLKGAADVVLGILAPFAEAQMLPPGSVKPNVKEIVNEAFGAAGYKDGGDRFFEIADMDQMDQVMQAGMGQQDPAAAAEAEQAQAATDAMKAKTAADAEHQQVMQGAQQEQARQKLAAQADAQKRKAKADDENEKIAAMDRRLKLVEMATRAAKAGQGEEGSPLPAGVKQLLDTMLQEIKEMGEKEAPQEPPKKPLQIEFIRDANGNLSGARVVPGGP